MQRTVLKTAPIVILMLVSMLDVRAAEKTLRIAYMKHPIQEASIEILESWAADNDVRIVRVPIAYEVFHQKITATLTSGGNQFDIVWHNDDWGQIWKKWLAPTTEVAGMDQVDRRSVEVAFLNDVGEPTVVPMVHTLGLLMYRTDLISEDELPESWDDLVAIGRRLQASKKVRWGFVGGMAMNHTWFTLLWSTWSNGCDVFAPPYERQVVRLSAEGWSPMMAQPCQQQVVEFWWDAMNDHKISPRAMTTYSRNDANAIFLAGDAAFTVADTTMFGQFNDPRRSRVAGKVGMAGFPRGPMRTQPIAWNAIWGWAVPRSISEERKALAMEALGASLLDEEGQIQLWHKTGGPPPNRRVWTLLADDDPIMAAIRRYALDLDQVVAGSYYMPQWPAVHRAYSDGIVEALTGSREAIPQVLQEAAVRVRAAVKR
jgi:ABC-type glycerol-3-phosphate transport system substrate-binding protein